MEPWERLFDLRGKVALVTGGAMGIGEGISARLAELGAKVVVADRDTVVGPKAVERLAAGATSPPRFVPVDLADPSSPTRLIESVAQAEGKIDILVNNAGIFPISPATETPPELWERVLAVNLRAPFFLSQAFARAARARGAPGAIVNIASIDAIHPTGMLAHYDASKGGLAMLTRSLALEFAPDRIRVNAVAPGAIQTPGATASAGLPPSTAGGAAPPDAAGMLSAFLARIPARRMGTPDDIARAVVFLASPVSDYVTGAMLVVDGGYLLS
ncbi:MAG: SDR family oxidoreductase [Thermoplasmata archaeon]